MPVDISASATFGHPVLSPPFLHSFHARSSMNLGAMQGYSYVAADDSSSLHTFDGTCHGRRRPSPLVLNVVYIAMRSLLAANNGTNATRAQMYREMCNIMRRAW